jgi:hypothetical protein
MVSQRRSTLRVFLLAGAALLIAAPAMMALTPGLAPFSSLIGLLQPPSTPANTVPINVALAIFDQEAVPWTGEVEVQLLFEPSRARASATGIPDAAGNLTVLLHMEPEIVAAESASVAVWQAASDVSPELFEQAYFDPSLGTAAFADFGVLVYSEEAQVYMAEATVFMTDPPYFGQITVNRNANCSTAPMELVVLDFQSGYLGRERYIFPEVTERLTLPNYSGTFDIYRWGDAGAVHTAILGDRNTLLFQGTLRRNGQITADVTCERTITVDVDLSVHPAAHRVVFVRPEHHVPNQNPPFFSDVRMNAQLNRAVRESRVDLEPGDNIVEFVYSSEEIVVELWDRVPDGAGYSQNTLLDAVTVPAGAASTTVTFD